jgi:hypothetical protein
LQQWQSVKAFNKIASERGKAGANARWTDNRSQNRSKENSHQVDEKSPFGVKNDRDA